MFLWNWNKTRCKNSIKIFLVMTSLIHTYFHEKVHLNRYGKTEAIWWSFSFFFFAPNRYRINGISVWIVSPKYRPNWIYSHILSSWKSMAHNCLVWIALFSGESSHIVWEIYRDVGVERLSAQLHSPFWREAPNHRYHFSSNET